MRHEDIDFIVLSIIFGVIIFSMGVFLIWFDAFDRRNFHEKAMRDWGKK